MLREENIVIVGGGLVGSLLAITLKDMGMDPLVIEKRSDPRTLEAEAEGRSINLALTAKGIHALKELGLVERVLKICSPVYGRMIHDLKGDLTYQAYGGDEDCNYSVSRGELNKLLILRGLELGVRYEFSADISSYDGDKNIVEFKKNDQMVYIKSKHFFGTDGAGSKMRASLVDLLGGQEDVDFLDQRYKELLVSTEDGKNLERKALHIWPRGHHMLMALINQDHSFTLTLYLDQNGNKFGFGYLDSAAKVKEYFATYFADVIALIPDLESSFLANPVGKLGTVRTDTWFNKDKVVLLGDASHAIVPFFGQGMNSGFQDVTIIKDLWTEYKDWAKVFPKFYEIQKPNADAIADMALENFVEMSDKVGDKHFLMQKKVESIFYYSFPTVYISSF
jgi:kynurenine 3-monooxygenase